MTETDNIIQKEHPDLYKRSIKGGYWVFAIRFATQFLGFVKSIIIFNFLFSENLELIIVANLLIAVLNTFSQSGFRAALIQKKENIEEYLDTAWVIDILRGLFLFALIFFIAPFFASFRVVPEDIPLAISVIRAMGLCVLIGAFQNIGIVYFQKEMQFHKTFWLTMAGSITDIVLSITLVLVFKSVWGYVIARLITAVVNLTMTYLLCSYRPKFHFVPEKARELWQFGKWLFGFNIIGYLLNEGDDWFVWFYLGSGPLKLYRFAFQFSQMPDSHISSSIAQVSFPAYSKIQDDLPRLRQAYLKVLQITSLVSIPAAFLILTLSPDFVRLFLLEESHAMIPVIQILSLRSLMGSIGSTRGSLFRARGETKIIWKLHCIRLLILTVIIYPFTRNWGIIGTTIAMVTTSLFVNTIAIHKAKKALKCSVWDLRRPTFIPFVSSILMSLVFFLIRYSFIKTISCLSFSLLLIISISSYFCFLWILDVIYPNGIQAIIREQFKSLKERAKKNKDMFYLWKK